MVNEYMHPLMNTRSCSESINSQCSLPIVGASPSLLPPETSAVPPVAASPPQLSRNIYLKQNHHPYHLSVVPGIGVAVTALAITMLAVLVFLIRRKSRELKDMDTHTTDEISPKAVTFSAKKFQDGMYSLLLEFPLFVNIMMNIGVCICIYYILILIILWCTNYVKVHLIS